MFVIEDIFQNDGYAVWFKLLEISFQIPYALNFRDKAIWRYFLAVVHMSSDEERATNILNALADYGAIDKRQWTLERIVIPQKVMF